MSDWQPGQRSGQPFDDIAPKGEPKPTPDKWAGRSRWPYVGLGLLVGLGIAAWALIFGGDEETEPSTTTDEESTDSLLTGTLTAPECGGGYDIEFASVTVRNERDEIIGASTTSGDTVFGVGCTVEFTVDLEEEAQFYALRIGTHGGPTYSHAEMEALGFNVALSLD